MPDSPGKGSERSRGRTSDAVVKSERRTCAPVVEPLELPGQPLGSHRRRWRQRGCCWHRLQRRCCLLSLIPQLVLGRTLLRPLLLAGQAGVTVRSIVTVFGHLHTWCQVPLVSSQGAPCEIRAVEATAVHAVEATAKVKLKLQTTTAKLLI